MGSAMNYNTWGKSWGVSWASSWGVAEQSARSGYWRLFYYQLQEESLEKAKPPVQPADPAITGGELASAQPHHSRQTPPRKKSGAKKAPHRSSSEVPNWTPPVLPAFQRKIHEALPELVTPQLSIISNELYRWWQMVRPMQVALDEQRRRIIAQAANDDDDEFAIVLLLAA